MAKRRIVAIAAVLVVAAGGIVIAVLSFITGATPVPVVSDVPETPVAWADAWTGVLAHNVDDHGRIDFGALRDDHRDLDRVVAYIAAVDPISRPADFPDSAARLAYYINTYNGLAMYGVVDAGVPKSLAGLRKISFFVLRRFTIGGERQSLYSLENKVIRALGEERIHFALNCMVVGCPRLPQQAFTPDRLEAQLQAAATEFVNEARNVRVDNAHGELRLSAIFRFYTKDFLVKAEGLADYVNRYRRQPVPAALTVRYFDYDWTINVQPGAG